MYGKRKLSGHHRAQSPARASNTTITAMCIISAIIASVIIFSVVILAGEPKKAIQISPRAVTRSSSPASPLGGGRKSDSGQASQDGSAVTTLPLDEPLVGGDSRSPGQGGSSTPTRVVATAPRERPAIEAMQSAVVEAQAARERQARADLVARLTAHMQQTNTVQGLVDLAPLMVDLGQQTGNDPRLCPVTATEESSGGRVLHGDYNPFGIGGQAREVDFGSWEEVVRYYFAQITSYGCNGDIWHIAFIWYDASDPGGRATSYANNILRAVQSF